MSGKRDADLLEAVVSQAGVYGTQVRVLEDKGDQDGRRRTRAAWMIFLKELEEPLAIKAVDAYYEEYCKY